MDTVVTFSEKKFHRKLRICVFKKPQKKLRLQDAFHLENNEIVKFKISCRPDFQDICWEVFGFHFSISNYSQVICIFDRFGMN